VLTIVGAVNGAIVAFASVMFRPRLN